jgi:hypothetical protein
LSLRRKILTSAISIFRGQMSHIPDKGFIA